MTTEFCDRGTSPASARRAKHASISVAADCIGAHKTWFCTSRSMDEIDLSRHPEPLLRLACAPSLHREPVLKSSILLRCLMFFVWATAGAMRITDANSWTRGFDPRLDHLFFGKYFHNFDIAV